MIIRRFKKEDSKEVCKLVSRTFEKYVAPTFTKKGTKIWLSNITPKKFIERAKTKSTWIAIEKGKIIGIVQGSKKNNFGPCLLFVDKRYMKRGIATKLMKKLFDLAKRKKIKYMKIWSSLNAVSFYKKIGFKKTGKIVNKNGIIGQPMKKILESK